MEAREARIKEVTSGHDLDTADPSAFAATVRVIVGPSVERGDIGSDSVALVERAVLSYALGTSSALEKVLKEIT
jgi:hypothetical protein